MYTMSLVVLDKKDLINNLTYFTIVYGQIVEILGEFGNSGSNG